MTYNYSSYILNNRHEIECMILFAYRANCHVKGKKLVAQRLANYIHEVVFNEHSHKRGAKHPPLYEPILKIIKDLIQSQALDGSINNNEGLCHIPILDGFTTEKVLTSSQELLDSTAINPFFINNGQCYEVAEKLMKYEGVQYCTIAMMETHESFKTEMMSTLSSGVNVPLATRIFFRANHEWVYSIKSKMHFDAEIVCGVEKIDDIPIFSRALASSVVHEKANIGGKWTKSYSQFVLDFALPCVFAHINHASELAAPINFANKLAPGLSSWGKKQLATYELKLYSAAAAQKLLNGDSV